jgi:hypothetical protein
MINQEVQTLGPNPPQNSTMDISMVNLAIKFKLVVDYATSKQCCCG